MKRAAWIAYRADEGELVGVHQTVDIIALIGNLNDKIGADHRFLASATLFDTDIDESSHLDGAPYDFSLGDGIGPIECERLNLLARHRYLEDSYSQTVNGVAGAGAVQESHIVSLEGSYGLDRFWTLGAKVRGRFTDTSALGAVNRQVGNDPQVGVGYSFGSFLDDLTDLEKADQCLFLNIVAKF